MRQRSWLSVLTGRGGITCQLVLIRVALERAGVDNNRLITLDDQARITSHPHLTLHTADAKPLLIS